MTPEQLNELRRAAYQAVADHKRDMTDDPAYRRAVKRIEAKASRKQRSVAK